MTLPCYGRKVFDMGMKILELHYDKAEETYFCIADAEEWQEIDFLPTWDVVEDNLELLWKRPFIDELAQLKDGSVVKIKDGLVFERFRGAWFTPGGATEYSDSDVASYGDGDILLEVK